MSFIDRIAMAMGPMAMVKITVEWVKDDILTGQGWMLVLDIVLAISMMILTGIQLRFAWRTA